MNVVEMIPYYLELLGLEGIDLEPQTIVLAGQPARSTWDAFKRFIATPIEGLHQSLIVEYFEYRYPSPRAQLCLRLMRSFFLPFADDPDAMYNLCFDVSTYFHLPDGPIAIRRWDQVELGDDEDAAIGRFTAMVEGDAALWQLLATATPVETQIFV